MQHLQPKTTLQGGKYRIERVLGQGGFGNTYIGINTGFDERIAIKEFFLKGVTERDETTSGISVVSSDEDTQRTFHEQKEKFKKEAKRLRKLRNSHIVSVHDLFEENGTAYYIMDYIDGENLAERMKRTGKPLPEQEVWKILAQVLDALKEAHSAGLLHLDIKPGNIMVDMSDNARLIDFGASKQIDDRTGGALTGTAVARTPGYAPREQMEQSYKKMGPWTDIYALGATLYAILTNERPPLPSDIDDDDSDDKHEALPMPQGISKKMRDLIIRMMNTNRHRRPQSVDEVMSLIGINSGKAEQTAKNASNNGEETEYAKPQEKKSEDTVFDTRKTVQKEVQQNNKPQRQTVQVNNDNNNDSDDGSTKALILLAAAVIFVIILICIANIQSSDKASEPMGATSNQSTTSTSAESSATYGKKRVGFYPMGSGTYEGGLLNGEMHGHGTITYDNGQRFTGEFVNGKTHGHGTLTSVNGNVVFDGEYKYGERISGTQTFANGNKFTGTYEYSSPKNGTLTSASGEVLFKGEFYYGGGYKTGTGKEKHDNYSYEGEYKDGKYDGDGVQMWSNVKYNHGYKYEGKFKNGYRNGYGTMYYKNAGKYEGNWVDGERNGTGTYYYADHTFEEGVWKNGEKVKVMDSGTWSEE